MRERSYRVRSRSRSPSPRRPSPRHRRYSPYHCHGTEQYPRGAEISKVIDRGDHFDKDSNTSAPRLTEYDNRDRDRYLVGSRRSRSPRIIKKQDDFDRNGSMRTARLSDAGGDIYKSRATVSSSYDEDSYRGMKFQLDHLLDGPRRSDRLSLKDYSHSRDYNVVDDAKVTSVGDERDYDPRSHYLDSDRSRLLSVSQYLDSAKPVPLQYERGVRTHSRLYTLADGGVKAIPVSKFGGGDGGSHLSSVASRYSDTHTDNLVHVHSRDELHSERRYEGLPNREVRYFEKENDVFHPKDGFLGIEKTVGRESYKFTKEDYLLYSRGYLKGDSDYMLSSSQPKDYVSVSSGVLREGFPGYSGTEDLYMPSDVIRQGSELTSQPISFDGYSEKRQDISARGPGDQLYDKRSSSRLYIGLPEEKHGDQLYEELGRSKISRMNRRIHDAEEKYRDQYISRFDVLDPTVDEFSHKRPIRDDGQWEQYPFVQVQSTPDKYDERVSLHRREQDLDMLVTGSSHLNYGREEYRGYGSVEPELCHAEADGAHWSHVERSDILQSRAYDPSIGRPYDSPGKRHALSTSSFPEPSPRRLRNNYVKDEELFDHGIGIRISTDGSGARKIYNDVNVQDEIDIVNFSKKPQSSKSDYEETCRTLRKMGSDRPSSPKWNSSHSGQTNRSDSRDIKNRLGPLPRKLHVSQRLVSKYKPSIKKRLAPARPMKHDTYPWVKNRCSDIMVSARDDSDGSPHVRDGNQSEDHPFRAKTEPPEKSEDFKQLMQSAFFKFLKQINETPTKRKIYMEQGKAGSLKCIVCGSNSDEFVETESLAMHAFTSKQAGLRSQHLGLHKALCVLMGWKIEDRSGEWHCEFLSNAEASAFKEDLIIWPPVVIVHNSTIDNKNADERVVVSTEKLDVKLRDMGYQSILKVCKGKPANLSIMLVKFNGTLSGLREAEKLHRSYVQSRPRRAEPEQSKAEIGSSSGATQSDRELDILNGHLGNAEDMDKLDFDTKKRCVLRSKKEILSIVNASLNTER